MIFLLVTRLFLAIYGIEICDFLKYFFFIVSVCETVAELVAFIGFLVCRQDEKRLSKRTGQ